MLPAYLPSQTHLAASDGQQEAVLPDDAAHALSLAGPQDGGSRAAPALLLV